MPGLLQEIGRQRELTFREVGEGSGKSSDLDHFDFHYRHLFLWSRTERRLAGAYRLAVTTDVIPLYGVQGLYTSTLFRFQPEFFDRLGPALELGRSFVCPEYQKDYAPLLLLWKGIARFVCSRPEVAVLFGAVSISRDYKTVSRALMARYLSERASHELARLAKARLPLRTQAAHSANVKRLAALVTDVEELSLAIADIEADGKGVPVLIRQYLKTGGRVLGFNVDPKFSNSLDALMLTDLRIAPTAWLERCMGKREAREFLVRHQR
jgi:hypothetical protein